ncbi:MAG TPA: LUD domain-containing protein, partial [Azonexus sp.]|nr:LUD domain-containing protein [Azonexus sp.]
MTDNATARAQILQRVSKGVGKADFVARRAVAEAALAAPVCGPQPVIASSLVSRFQARAESLASTVDRVANPAQAVAAVAHYLAVGDIGSEAVATPDLRGFDWAGGGLTVRVGAAVDADKVGISGCFCAIAETGTLMLLSGPESPATVSLLPETHIALVPVGRIVATMEDAFALLRREHGSVPRAINFIS